MIAGVEGLEPDTEEECKHTEACKEKHGHGIVVIHRIGYTGVSPLEHVADEDGEEGEADVLHPED